MPAQVLDGLAVLDLPYSSYQFSLATQGCQRPSEIRRKSLHTAMARHLCPALYVRSLRDEESSRAATESLKAFHPLCLGMVDFRRI